MATATRVVTYNDQETALTGFLAWDDVAARPAPGLLLVHGGAGLDDHAKGQARRYAAHGYAVLACDMFGEGVAGNRERVVACLTGLRDDPQRMSRRAEAGLATRKVASAAVDRIMQRRASCLRSNSRPRASRLRTVPSGQPSCRAASSWVWSSRQQRTIA